MNIENIRVRFAPSPTGFMHLGNVRTALINYLFANQKNGVFLLRIEDTDKERNIGASNIFSDLKWLNLNYTEGPYYQSDRAAVYSKYLDILKEKNLVYRCFCSSEELQKKRDKQLAIKQPPKYNRACLKLSDQEITNNLKLNKPFIWRFKLNTEEKVSFYDLAHKQMTFELGHFSDIPITRQDGTFTFLFANFVDDHEMNITHVFRGEDHLTNTAAQVAIYKAFNANIPIFWHLPIMSNKEGKKLSKRDFGFSLNDLKNGGFLPEAICNYLAIIGGSYPEEIMDMQSLINNINFENISPTGQIRYDLDKLRWVNHQWIMRKNISELSVLVRPILEKEYGQAQLLSDFALNGLVKLVQEEIVVLPDIINLLQFYFQDPNPEKILSLLADNQIDIYSRFFANFLLTENLEKILQDHEQAYNLIRSSCKSLNMPIKNIFILIRIALTGKQSGLGIKELISILSPKTIINRFKTLVYL